VLPLGETSWVLKPTTLIDSFDDSPFTLIEKLPFASVVTTFFVPTSVTEANFTGSPA